MRKIVIVGSASFYMEVLDFKKKLEDKDYEVVDYPKNISESNLTFKDVYENFFENLNNTDDLLLLNFDKKGVAGYIGYESFAELSYFIIKKVQENNNHNIYIYKMPSKSVGCYDEIVNFLELGYIELWRF